MITTVASIIGLQDIFTHVLVWTVWIWCRYMHCWTSLSTSHYTTFLSHCRSGEEMDRKRENIVCKFFTCAAILTWALREWREFKLGHYRVKVQTSYSLLMETTELLSNFVLECIWIVTISVMTKWPGNDCCFQLRTLLLQSFFKVRLEFLLYSTVVNNQPVLPSL